MRAQVSLYSLEIKPEHGLVNVLDARRKDTEDYADMSKMLEK